MDAFTIRQATLADLPPAFAMSSQAQFVAALIVIFIIAALAYWVYLQTAPMD